MFELKKQLKMAENNYQTFYEFAPTGYFELSECNRIIKVNLTGSQLLGVPRSHLFGKRFTAFISKNSQPTFHTHLQQLFSTKIKQSCKLELLKKDGSSFYSQIDSVAVFDPLQKITSFRLSIIDINEHRLTEQALQSSEEKFRSIVETTKEWIWTIDLKGRFLYNNPAVLTILGYFPSELLNRNRLTFIHQDDRSLIAKIFPLVVRENHGWNDLTLRWQCKDGSTRYLESNAVPFFNSQGKLLGFRGADRDITLRKQTEEETYKRQIVLNKTAKRNSLGELASTLAHELTQPLTAINNFVTGCIKRLNSNMPHNNALLLDALTQASQQAERAGQIIHRMRNFAKHGKLNFEKVSVNEIIQESIVLVKREFEPNKLPISITADKIQLEQVMLNLLRNAIEAMINASTSDPELQIKYEFFSKQYILVSVSDNGPGFCLDDGINKVFEPYFTTKSNGLGMGLSISRTIIEAHTGHLTGYKNTHNKGMCFQFTLPVNQNHVD